MEIEERIKSEYEIKINDYKLKIEMINEEIIFILLIGLSYKYIKKYKYNEIINELNLKENKDLKELYLYLIKSEYKIIDEEKKIIINNNKEIKLNETIITNEEMIKILIDERKEMKEKNKNKINELIKMNEEKENKMNILENKYNELKEMVYDIDDNIKDKYKDEINIIYRTEKEDNYNIFGEKFVEINKNNIELNINGNKSNLISKYKLKEGDNNIKMIIKNKIIDLQYMFYYCNNLKYIEELKYLNTKYCNNFYICSLIVQNYQILKH